MRSKPRLADAFETPESKFEYNRALFATIAPRYDLITRVLSYGQDARWKRSMIETMRREGPARPRMLDLACGTGDLALAALPHAASVAGLDLTTEMLSFARRRQGAARVSWLAGDMTRLPFAGASFDVVTTGYGLRNVPALERALAEIVRVLRRPGLLISLDFNKPASPLARGVFLAYLTAVGSTLGFLLHGDPDTYRYIPQSIRRYPGADGVSAMMRAAGFDTVRLEPKLGGFMSIHVAGLRL